MNRSTNSLVLIAAFAMLASQAPLARAGDFNHDGFDDLAIGVPGETVGNTRGGAVAVIYGSSSGLNATAPPDQIFSQDTPGMPGTVEFGDDFGLALTTGDFDGDGFDDLAIGVPDEDIGTTVDAGVVMVIFGGPNGLSTSPRTAQSFNAVAPIAQAQFGRSLACDDFDHDGFDDLAIGVPGETVSTRTRAGSVNVLFGSPQGLTVTRRQILTQNTAGVADSAETNDAFGFALAAGDFNGDQFGDLAVGVPFEDNGGTDTGMVQVLFGGTIGFNGASVTFEQGVNGMPGIRLANDHFGQALSGIRHAFSPLAIGCPADNDSPLRSGSVTVLPRGLSIANATFISEDFVGGLAAPTTGDRFGASVVVSDFGKLVFPNAFFDVAIGAPGATVVNGGAAVPNAGVVYVVYGNGSTSFDLAHPQILAQGLNGLLETAEQNDGFGSQLASGNFGLDPLGDLVVGVPLEDSGLGDVGVVHAIYGNFGLGLRSTGNQIWSQNTINIEENSEAGDKFGASVTGR